MATTSMQAPRHTASRSRALGTALLEDAYAASPILPIDRRSRLVLFSDCHRGAGGSGDAFAPNKQLYLAALDHYIQAGFTYVEVGDGDELWKGWHYDAIRSAHPQVFYRLSELQSEGLLHRIIGNHELLPGREPQRMHDEFPLHPGLILDSTATGQRIFVVHGHQADPHNASYNRFSHSVVRYLWSSVQRCGLVGVSAKPRSFAGKPSQPVATRIARWASARGLTVICGHTHQPAYAQPGGPAYFNTGSCIYPGYLTGIEIHGNDIIPVRWSYEAGRVEVV
ncbi:MAG: metallophosphoesterase family protein [Caldilineae bacterium]|nr:metallophosphoesterase family protein [Anaerolineae bacterium]MCB0254581.1 metallophosphoesterase family protein [Anaerolineae bacterium]MCB9140603.1 metallophosphoesterase family protein [Caldilineaceae bacterium]MCB9153040.1 metallophosphoesterase family protein [Caldilineae bacterium]